MQRKKKKTGDVSFSFVGRTIAAGHVVLALAVFNYAGPLAISREVHCTNIHIPSITSAIC